MGGPDDFFLNRKIIVAASMQATAPLLQQDRVLPDG